MIDGDTIEAAIAGAGDGPEGLRGALDRLAALLPASRPSSVVAIDELRLLHHLGRRDLPLGRVFEGHVDARGIVARLGGTVPDGAVMGVWNADLPGEPLRLEGERLTGAKSFASGAGVLSHALVTADTAGGRQALLLNLARTPPAIDRSWWRVIGMRRSETHIVRWHDAAIGAGERLGEPGDYAREPWFGGGALRFVAVHAGGVAALFERTRAHLVANGRAGDPHQEARLARLFSLAQLAADAVAGTAAREADDAAWLARVAAARLQVAGLAEEALRVAQEAAGVQALFEDHPLAATITDLSVYLRQPAPDAQRARVGRAAAAGMLVPLL